MLTRTRIQQHFVLSFSFLFATVLFSHVVHAANTVNITVVNASAVVGGDQTIYISDTVNLTANSTGTDTFLGADWGIRCTDCIPLPDWTVISGTVTASGQMTQLGSFGFQAECVFTNTDMTSYYSVVATVAVTVAPPTNAVLEKDPDNPVLDTNQPTTTLADGPNLALYFYVTGGSRELALDASTSAMEQIDRAPYGKAPDMPMGPAPYLSFIGLIYDMKGVVGDAGYLAAANGVIDEFDQTLAVVLPTGCGATRTVTLAPKYHFQMIKINNSYWQLHQP